MAYRQRDEEREGKLAAQRQMQEAREELEALQRDLEAERKANREAREGQEAARKTIEQVRENWMSRLLAAWRIGAGLGPRARLLMCLSQQLQESMRQKEGLVGVCMQLKESVARLEAEKAGLTEQCMVRMWKQGTVPSGGPRV
jgi:chromosome segregation ATPase